MLFSIQKPTCMVSPMNKTTAEPCVQRGMTGLDNLGNTCFMNSVLQILANTRELRDYFLGKCFNCFICNANLLYFSHETFHSILDSTFQKELNTENPLGTKGKLAVAYGVLLRVLWSGKYHSYAPSKLKVMISCYVF